MREVFRSVSSSQQGEFWAQDELLSDEEPVGLPDAGAEPDVENVLPAPKNGSVLVGPQSNYKMFGETTMGLSAEETRLENRGPHDLEKIGQKKRRSRSGAATSHPADERHGNSCSVLPVQHLPGTVAQGACDTCSEKA